MATRIEKMSRTKQDGAIRKLYGHGKCTRWVRVKRDGTVEVKGSRDSHTDRQRDFWAYAGTRAEALAELTQREDATDND